MLPELGLGHEVLRQPEVRYPHEDLVQKIETAGYPYERALEKLDFLRPAIRVASCEGARSNAIWRRAFSKAFDDRLEHLYLVVSDAHATMPHRG
jgi:hypothetical protein